MKTAVIIPARFASERFPGKPLALIGGVPMIVRVLQRAQAAQGVDQVVVATDDDAIAAAVRSAGGEVALTPAGCPSGSDRCAHAARTLGEPDVVINVQGDEPLLDPRAIEQLLEAFLDPKVQVATLARPLEPGERDNPNVVKVVRDLRGDALYFSRAPIPSWGGQGDDPARAHVGIYGFRGEALQAFTKLPPTPLEQAERLEQLRLLEHGTAIRVLGTSYRSIGVDTPEDLERVRRLFSAASMLQ